MGFRAKTPTGIEGVDLIDLDYAKRIIGGFTISSAKYNDNDTLIGDLISAASLICTGDVRSYRHVEYTELEDGKSSSNVLWVANPPIDSAQPVKVWQGRNTSYAFDDDHLLTLHEDYEVVYEWGKIAFHAMLWDGIQNYQMLYTGGYQSGQVPADLQTACALIVADLYKLPEDRRHGLVSKARDGQSEGLLNVEIPPRALFILRKYWGGPKT